jgi:cytochrome oxidase Cu insertion factor (SCO1/SenC/PrrC family)
MKLKLWLSALAGVLFTALSLAAAAADVPAVGAKAPDFALPSSTGKEIKLGDFAGKKAVVLFFYIGAFTNT